jgi:ubiquinone/menaquinone biosynthesis C-methylase UbiE
MGTRQADEQAALWNGDAGRAWVEAQHALDGLFKPFEDQLVDAVRAGSARRVLDVGCGTGATTLAIARSLGANGRCVGVDISEPMLALASARAERERLPASFIRADAETHAFEPGTYDMIVSRFGVMFFQDFVRAFANLRCAAREGAELRVIAWRTPAENPFMTTAERAAAPLLPNIPPRRPDGPGQFALAERARVERILEESGWAEIDVRPIDVGLVLAEKDLDLYLTRLGPLGRTLADVDEQTRTRVIAQVRGAFDSFVHGDEVRFDAACWTICARSPVTERRT